MGVIDFSMKVKFYCLECNVVCKSYEEHAPAHDDDSFSENFVYCEDVLAYAQGQRGQFWDVYMEAHHA